MTKAPRDDRDMRETEAAGNKLAYRSPVLTSYGTLAHLTQNVGNTGADGVIGSTEGT
jgi:hypothetical protein